MGAHYCTQYSLNLASTAHFCTRKVSRVETIEQQRAPLAQRIFAEARAAARRPWLGPVALLALGLAPLAAGMLRLSQLARGVAASAENARFVSAPLPVVLHVVSATSFCVLGALQFAPALRERRWHRLAGRVALPAGLLTALSGLWMAFFYALPAGEDDLALKLLRLVFGCGMLLALLRGAHAIRNRSVAEHRVWMARGYAIGLGAGTQALLMIPWSLLLGKPVAPVRTLLMAAGWLLNLGLAERFCSRQLGTKPTLSWFWASKRW